MINLYFYQVRTIFWHNRWSGAVPHLSNRMKRSNFQKRDKTHFALGVCGVCGRKNFFTLSSNHAQSPKKSWKIFLSYNFGVGMGHFDVVRWKCDSVCIFSMLRDTLKLIFLEKSRQKMQRSEEEHFFAKGGFDRKEDISNTANKRCSRQVLQFRCSSWYSIKFYT